MADKTPEYGSTPLVETDNVLWKEIATEIYAQAIAASMMIGRNLISTANPLPVSIVAYPYQVIITPNHDEKIVNGNTQLVQANENRKYLLIINDSPNVIYLNLGNNANLNEGIRLNANGGSYEISIPNGNLYLGAIYANSAALSRVLLTGGV